MRYVLRHLKKIGFMVLFYDMNFCAINGSEPQNNKKKDKKNETYKVA